jgi:hypothetical protein
MSKPVFGLVDHPFVVCVKTVPPADLGGVYRGGQWNSENVFEAQSCVGDQPIMGVYDIDLAA